MWAAQPSATAASAATTTATAGIATAASAATTTATVALTRSVGITTPLPTTSATVGLMSVFTRRAIEAVGFRERWPVLAAARCCCRLARCHCLWLPLPTHAQRTPARGTSTALDARNGTREADGTVAFHIQKPSPGSPPRAGSYHDPHSPPSWPGGRRLRRHL